jgi:iron complex transport system substrate-binding protein
MLAMAPNSVRLPSKPEALPRSEGSLGGRLQLWRVLARCLLVASTLWTSWTRMEASERGEKVPAQAPTRVVSLAPSLTETIEALGAADTLVAITGFCRLQNPTPSIPRIARLDAPNLETLLSLKPDLVVATPLTRNEALEQIRALGMPLLLLPQQTLESIPDEIRQLARMLHRSEAAEALNERIEQHLQALKNRSRALPKTRVLLFYDWKALYSANGKTFAGQLLRYAGAENLAEDHAAAWPQLSVEWVLSSRPECILLSRSIDAPDPAPAALAAWKKDPLWSLIPAVRNGRVYSIADDLLAIPGPRMGEAAEAIWHAIQSPPDSSRAPGQRSVP